MCLFPRLVLLLAYLLLEDASAQAVVLDRNVSTPVLIRLGYQRSLDGIHIEPCGFGFFNDDTSRERCQSCGAGVSTARVGAVDLTECSVCDIEYTDAFCLVCRKGFYQKVDNGPCTVMSDVVVTLHVTVFVYGPFGNNVENQIVDAFADILQISLALFTNITRRPALTMQSTLPKPVVNMVLFDILVDGTIQANQLQRSVQNIDTTLLYTYPGLLGTNATVHTTRFSVDTSAVKQQSNIVFIIVVGIISLGCFGLFIIIMCCLCKKATRLTKATRPVILNKALKIKETISKHLNRKSHPPHHHEDNDGEDQPLTKVHQHPKKHHNPSS